ncbi:unnamed protein product [Chondrus crispus]|uniref:Uncharacterized protein n=1 Tax=Chondrus crispus TaxID=2769 RepID=R7Q7E6_CHOCR|nr:unnamed protein product [Chondrus crispus]CDF33390.1 unnamed protein product [Chondrus crispus]|eukprot:XP_005713193.1 unnamed protein product [Chondrus crispus]
MDDVLAGLIGCSASTRANVSQNKGKRAKRVRWSQPEVCALRTGVARYGQGRWAVILREFANDFHPCRISVDLKDKWRNLFKSQKTLLVAHPDKLTQPHVAGHPSDRKPIQPHVGPVHTTPVNDSFAVVEQTAPPMHHASRQPDDTPPQEHVNVTCEYGHEQPQSDADDQYVTIDHSHHHDNPHDHHHFHHHHHHHHHHLTASHEYPNNVPNARAIDHDPTFSEQVLVAHHTDPHHADPVAHLHHQHHHPAIHSTDHDKHPPVETHDQDGKEVGTADVPHREHVHHADKQHSEPHHHLDHEHRSSDIPHSSHPPESDSPQTDEHQSGAHQLPAVDGDDQLHHIHGVAGQATEVEDAYQDHPDHAPHTDHVHEHEDEQQAHLAESEPQEIGAQYHCPNHSPAVHSHEHVAHDRAESPNRDAAHPVADSELVGSEEHVFDNVDTHDHHPGHVPDHATDQAVGRAIVFEDEDRDKAGVLAKGHGSHPDPDLGGYQPEGQNRSNATAAEAADDKLDNAITETGQEHAADGQELVDEGMSQPKVSQEADESNEQLQESVQHGVEDTTTDGLVCKDELDEYSTVATEGPTGDSRKAEENDVIIHVETDGTTNAAERGVRNDIGLATSGESEPTFESSNAVGAVEIEQDDSDIAGEALHVEEQGTDVVPKSFEVTKGASTSDMVDVNETEAETMDREDAGSSSVDDGRLRMTASQVISEQRGLKRGRNLTGAEEQEGSGEDSENIGFSRKKGKQESDAKPHFLDDDVTNEWSSGPPLPQ